MTDQPPLDGLTSFAALADQLHFTRAAARLHVAQPALTKRIQQLERTLGVRLFVRTRRSVKLTSEGEVLLEKARQVIRAAEELAATARREARPRETARSGGRDPLLGGLEALHEVGVELAGQELGVGGRRGEQEQRNRTQARADQQQPTQTARRQEPHAVKLQRYQSDCSVHSRDVSALT